MKIFLTGGTGFLGGYLIERLLKDNHQILALTRKANAFIGKNIEEVVGQLSNIDEWKEKLIGCDVVIHCAAPVEFWGPWEKFYSEITLATKKLLEEAEKHNVKRFIYISSESVLQDKYDLIDVDENHPYPSEPNSYYGKSKMMAEQEIIKYDGKIETIILRPAFIYGTGTKSIEMMKQAIQKGKFVWIDRGNSIIEMVYVKNVAEAIVKALTNGKNKGIYFITDHSPQKVKEFLTKLLATQNISIPNKNIPSFVVKPIAVLVEKIWELFNIRSYPPLTRFDLSFVAMNRSYRKNKSITELKYRPIYSTEQALEEMNIKI